MNRNRAALLVGLTMTAVAAGAFVPAQAADTDVTFTISGGALTISAPSTVQNLGTAGTSPGSQTSAAFDAPVTVTDNRGELAAAWLATVSATDFTGITEGETISAAQANYASGAVTASTGLVVTPSISPTMAVDSTLAGVGLGSNTASWTPTVGVTVPIGAVADTYEGTVTHSVTAALP